MSDVVIGEYKGRPVELTGGAYVILLHGKTNEEFLSMIQNELHLAFNYGRWIFCFEGKPVAISYDRHNKYFFVYLIGDEDLWWVKKEWDLECMEHGEGL